MMRREPTARMARKRIGGQPVHGGRVVSLVEALEQVLLKERVRPVELIAARTHQNLRARERNQSISRVHAEGGAKGSSAPRPARRRRARLRHTRSSEARWVSRARARPTARPS